MSEAPANAPDSPFPCSDDPDAFFPPYSGHARRLHDLPDRGDSLQTRQARATVRICSQQCPLATRLACLNQAIETPGTVGIWGGTIFRTEHSANPTAARRPGDMEVAYRIRDILRARLHHPSTHSGRPAPHPTSTRPVPEPSFSRSRSRSAAPFTPIVITRRRSA